MYQLFVDSRADTLIKSKSFNNLAAYKILSKLIHLSSVTLAQVMILVKGGSNLFKAFTLTKEFINIIMENVLENADVNKTGTINTKRNIILAYADNISFVGRTERGVTDSFSKIKDNADD